MNIHVLFDSTARTKKFATGWGFSVLIDGRILFDTGEDGEALLHNMNKLVIDIEKIEAVVLSHEHWDHVDGLWHFLEKRKGIHVYTCAHIDKTLQEKIFAHDGMRIPCSSFLPLADNIYVTGEISSIYKGAYLSEQSLVTITDRGVSVITGCSHPGIVRVLEKVQNEFPSKKINTVIGGFHLKDTPKREIIETIETMQKMGITDVAPAHCCGNEACAIFKEYYKKHCLPIMVGASFSI